MPVATPLSLKNIFNEFGYGIISTNTFTSGSGSVTAPAKAKIALIKAWGGGGGGGDGDEDIFNNDEIGGGGGSGAYSEKAVAVTGGSTTISYSVGAAGAASGGDAGTSSASISGITQVSAGGGFGGDDASAGAGGGIGGTASSGTTNTSGNAGTNGSPSGSGFGGAALNNGYGAGGDGGIGPIGRGGAGAPGESGAVVIEWLGIALSEYTRAGGLVPNHSQNSNIPTSTTNLEVSDFNDGGLNFTATVTGDGTANHGYTYGVFGSIDRDQFGINRTNTNQRTIWALYETRTLTYDLLGNPNGYAYYLTLEIDGDTRSSTLGYDVISEVAVNGSKMFLDSVTYSFGTTKYTNSFGRQGSLVADAWLFDQTNGVSNSVVVYFNAPRILEYISTETVTSGEANILSGTPISPPSGATFAIAKLWGGGAGGSGGTGGGGGGFVRAEIELSPNEAFYYNVENGGNFGISGQNGGNTFIGSNTSFFYSATAYGGIWDGTGGTTASGFGTPWTLTFENGGNNSGSNGGNAGGLSYGGGSGGSGAGATPGAGGASGFAGGEARLIIDWYRKPAVASSY